MTAAKKRRSQAALWIASPFIVFAGIAFMQTITRVQAPGGLFFIDLLSIVIGSAGIVLLFLGPVVGILILRNK